ncbi:PhzF family phenazine biosynthesis protein [Thiomicrospira sp.]|uniref:PhzF family phenazine biosynthesis protein n=1 Tax=Thiomicrospira sp. TaxID=935 RepID=UPI002F95C9DD
MFRSAFFGNPAAVIPLEHWLPDETMQAIAEENNLSETVFFVPVEEHFYIRWFTPNKEVKLCGHATLASAFVLFEVLGYKKESIVFDSLSGPLIVTRQNGMLTMDFPAQVPVKCDLPEALVKGLGAVPFECYKNEDYVVVFESEQDVLNIKPDHRYLEKLDLRGVIVTAPSVKQDFVARFFAPKLGIPEDPVTGSAYTQLTPYWSERIGKTKLSGRQVSQRGGQVFCEIKGDRVFISGRAVKYMEGLIEF